MVRLDTFPIPTEGIRFQNSSVDAVIGDTDLGKGTLYVAESALSWMNAASGEGFMLDYTSMCLHAVSRDENVHPRACIYIMVNGKFCSDSPSEEDEEDEEMDPEEEISEIKLVPEDSELLQTIYTSVQECSLLHPDPASDMSEEDGDEEDVGGAGDQEQEMDSGEDDGRVPGLDGAGDNGLPTHPNQFDDANEEDSY